MKDTQILEQILNGYHLEPSEIERAKKLVKIINIYLKQQNPERTGSTIKTNKL